MGRTNEARRIGWVFHLGHGRYTQFLNFQENLPAEHASRSEWIGIPPLAPDNRPGKLALFNRVRRFRGHQVRELNSALAKRHDWQALFLAAQSIQFLPIVRRTPSYLYVDMTIAQLRDFSPWYDRMLSSELRANPILRRFQDRAHRALFRSARGVFAMSEWAASAVRREYGLPASQVQIALPGANLRRWHFFDHSVGSGQPVRILMVGGDFARKGGPLLLDWARRTQLRGWEMDVVTWSDELPVLLQARLGYPTKEERATCTLGPESSRVRIHTGIRANSPELQELYGRANVFCLPTLAEGTSNAALEGMASGLPVLVGAVGGIPELIQDGCNGLLLDPGNFVDLRTKLEAVLRDLDLRQRIGRAARARCEDYLNSERQIRQIISAIDLDS